MRKRSIRANCICSRFATWQQREIAGTFRALFSRIDEKPVDGRFVLEDEVFTHLDAYPDLEADLEVNLLLTRLDGLAVGLGYASALALYHAYCADFRRRRERSP